MPMRRGGRKTDPRPGPPRLKNILVVRGWCSGNGDRDVAERQTPGSLRQMIERLVKRLQRRAYLPQLEQGFAEVVQGHAVTRLKRDQAAEALSRRGVITK